MRNIKWSDGLGQHMIAPHDIGKQRVESQLVGRWVKIKIN